MSTYENQLNELPRCGGMIPREMHTCLQTQGGLTDHSDTRSLLQTKRKLTKEIKPNFRALHQVILLSIHRK